MTPTLPLQGRILSSVRYTAHCAAKINLPVLWEAAYGMTHDYWLSSTAQPQTLSPLEATWGNIPASKSHGSTLCMTRYTTTIINAWFSTERYYDPPLRASSFHLLFPWGRGVAAKSFQLAGTAHLDPGVSG